MGNTRFFVQSSSESVEVLLRSRLYSSDDVQNPRPRRVEVTARYSSEVPELRYPVVESFLGANARLQPFIHNVPVTVEERGKVYHFMVFFKRHRYFTPNKVIKRLLGRNITPVICSDVLIMRIGKRTTYVNMRGRDSVVADFAVKKLSQELSLKHRYIRSVYKYRKNF